MSSSSPLLSSPLLSLAAARTVLVLGASPIYLYPLARASQRWILPGCGRVRVWCVKHRRSIWIYPATLPIGTRGRARAHTFARSLQAESARRPGCLDSHAWCRARMLLHPSSDHIGKPLSISMHGRRQGRVFPFLHVNQKEYNVE